MQEEIHHLLYDVPDSADYAVDVSELDPEDIPLERVVQVLKLLDSADVDVRFSAARILCSWGYEEGLVVLESFIDDPSRMEGFFTHRLHGFDDTPRFVLSALTSFVANNAGQGRGAYAHERVHDSILTIINMAKEHPFMLGYFLCLIKHDQYQEFIPALKDLLAVIVDKGDEYYWNIKDLVALLIGFDPIFVYKLFLLKGKTYSDFNLKNNGQVLDGWSVNHE